MKKKRKNRSSTALRLENFKKEMELRRKQEKRRQFVRKVKYIFMPKRMQKEYADVNGKIMEYIKQYSDDFTILGISDEKRIIVVKTTIGEFFF